MAGGASLASDVAPRMEAALPPVYFSSQNCSDTAIKLRSGMQIWRLNHGRDTYVVDANYPAGAHASTWLRLPASSHGAIGQSAVVAPDDQIRRNTAGYR